MQRVEKKVSNKLFNTPKREVVLLSILNVCYRSFSLVVFYLFSELIDSFLVCNSFERELLYSIISSVILTCIVEVIRKMKRNKAFFSLLKKCQLEFFYRLSSSVFNDISFDDRQHIISESLSKICFYFVDSVPSFVGDIVQSFVYFFLGVLINPFFAVIVLIFSLLVVLWQNKSMDESQEVFEEGERNESDFLGFVRRTMDNHEIIQTMLDEGKISDLATERMMKRNASWMRSLIPLFRTSSIGTATFHLTGFLSIILGALLYHRGLITIGEVLIFYQVANSMTSAFEGMYSFFSSKTEYRGVRSFVEEFFLGECAESLVDEHCSFNKELVLSSVSFRYPSQKNNAVSNVSYSFSLGKLYCIRGPNGSGKSTLGLLISKMLPLSVGTISCSDREVLYFGKENRFIPTSVVCNITGSDEADTIENLKKEMCAFGGPLAKNLSERLTELISVEGEPFSAGEKQMILFFRSIQVLKVLEHPVFAIFDETTSSMDKDSKSRVVGKLRTLSNEGNGVILITHDSFELSCFDKNLYMEKGKIV